MYHIYRFYIKKFSIPTKTPTKRIYETVDFIPKTNKVNNFIYTKKTNFQISDTFKNIPMRERYETIDF